MATSPKDLAPQQTGPLEAGTLLQARYKVERLLGGGGMGMVYLAHDQRLSNRPCAIKEMVDHFIDPQHRIEANQYFAPAVRGGPLPEALVIDVARQLSEVLSYLHGLSPPLIYRDMKPSNVMLTAAGRAVVVDFGLAG